MALYIVKDVIVDHYRDEISSAYSTSSHYGVLNSGEFDHAITELWKAARVDGLTRDFFNTLVEYEVKSHGIEPEVTTFLQQVA